MRWHERSWEEQRLLALALLVVLAVRLGLWTLPFRCVRRMVGLGAGSIREGMGSVDGELWPVIWAVRAAAKRIPKATCLTQALAAQFLLARRGIYPELKIGVVVVEKGSLEGHAWLEWNGEVILGGTKNLGRFQPLS